MIKLKRAYEAEAPGDGKRFLVERLWPRGLRKELLRLDEWMKDVAPSTELRKWFSHDPAKWGAFRRRYQQELDSHRAAWEPILEAARHGTVTLIYSSHDTEHNAAVVLKDYLDSRMARKHAPAGRRAA